jgi:hypothetical protein
MNWDELENIINKKRDDFDSENPVEGHNSRFLNKLNQYHKSSKIKYQWKIFKIAASFSALLITSTFVIWAYFQLSYKPKFQFNITQSAIEFREAQDYYAEQIKFGEEQLRKLPFKEPDQIDIIFAGLKNMDKNNQQLQSELISNPNDERLMNAVIGLYLVKLDAINQIIQSFSITENKVKPPNYENNI